MRYSVTKYTNVLGKFPPNGEVTISLVDLETLQAIPVISNVCTPVPSNPSYYVWNILENLAPENIASDDREYLYVMSDGINEFPGKIVVGGYGDLKSRINEWTETVFKVETGRWKINADDYTMTFYDEDGTTPLFKYDLKDPDGNPSVECPFERIPTV